MTQGFKGVGSHMGVFFQGAHLFAAFVKQIQQENRNRGAPKDSHTKIGCVNIGTWSPLSPLEGRLLEP